MVKFQAKLVKQANFFLKMTQITNKNSLIQCRIGQIKNCQPVNFEAKLTNFEGKPIKLQSQLGHAQEKGKITMAYKNYEK